jgi:hypothetical protein
MSVAAANYAIRHCRLQDVAAKMVLTALAWKSHPETPHLAFIGNEQLRQETGLKSVNGVKDALRRLIAAGEVRIIEVGGRGQSTNYELVGVRQWLESGEVSPSDISDYDSKVSASDSNCQMATVNYRHLTPIDNKTIKKQDKGADAPATATPLPSPPISDAVESQPQKPRPQKPKFDATAIVLPHRSPGFAAAWAEYAQHRREKRNPLTRTAAERSLKQLGKFNEQQAVELLHRAVANGYTGVVFPSDLRAIEPKVVRMPRQGPVQPSEAERRMLEMEARMRGAA